MVHGSSLFDENDPKEVFLSDNSPPFSGDFSFEFEQMILPHLLRYRTVLRVQYQRVVALPQQSYIVHLSQTALCNPMELVHHVVARQKIERVPKQLSFIIICPKFPCFFCIFGDLIPCLNNLVQERKLHHHLSTLFFLCFIEFC